MSRELNLTPKDAAALQDFTRRVREVLQDNLLALKLFGSKATGQDSPESDIDVLVVVRTLEASVEDLVLDIAFDVNLMHDVYISPKVIPKAVLEDPVWRITPFLRHLEKEGIAL